MIALMSLSADCVLLQSTQFPTVAKRIFKMAAIERKHVSKLVPENLKVLSALLLAVAIVNSAVSIP